MTTEEPPEAVLPVAVIYRNPSDYPDKYVLRMSYACKDGTVRLAPEPLAVVDTLTQARAAVPPQQDYYMPRQPQDDPVIVETWF